MAINDHDSDRQRKILATIGLSGLVVGLVVGLSIWIEAEETLEAEFSASPTAGSAPLSVDLTDQSLGTVDEWQWDFGDGGVSTKQHPTYIYENPGTYTVELTVISHGPYGDSDTETKIDYITVEDPTSAPEVSTEPATEVQTDQATLHGELLSPGPILVSREESLATDWESASTLSDLETDGDDLILKMVGEAGIEPVPSSAAWTTVSLSRSYTDPIAFALSNTENGAESPKVGEVKNVNNHFFETRVCEHETGYGCDSHAAEEVGWAVFDLDMIPSVAGIDGGRQVISGLDANNATTISFTGSFSNSPVVIAQIQNSDNHEVIAQVNNVTTDSFELYLCGVGSGENDCGSYDPQSVAWVAIDPNADPIGSESDLGLTSMANSEWTTQSFTFSFSTAPAVLATIQTNNGYQQHKPSMARNVTVNDMDIRYCEHNGVNECDTHNTEDVGWLALQPGRIEAYTSSGYRVRAPLDLGSVKNATSSSISWTASTPAGTEAKVQTALTDGSEPYSLEFDGSSSEVGIDTVNLGSDWSISFWGRPFSDDLDRGMITNDMTGNDWGREGISNWNGLWRVRDSADNIQSFSHVLDEWQLVTYTRDGTTVRGYLNGELQFSEDFDPFDRITDIAVPDSNEGRYQGRLDDLRIYSRALTAQEIQDLHDYQEVSTADLDHHWLLDEGAGSTVQDSVGNNDGSLSNVIWISDSGLYRPATNDSAVAGIEVGADLSDQYLWVRQELSSDDPKVTPELQSLDLSVSGHTDSADVHFTWGTDPEDLDNTTVSQSLSEPNSFEETITALTAGTEYHFQAVAVSSAGTSTGEVESFQSEFGDPSVTTLAATGISNSQATLQGELTDLGDGAEEAEVRFEWGETEGDLDQQSGWLTKTEPATFSHGLDNLDPSTTYYFRTVARNNSEQIFGDTLSLTTGSGPPAPTLETVEIILRQGQRQSGIGIQPRGLIESIR